MWKLLEESFRAEWSRLLQWSPRILLACVVILLFATFGMLSRRAIAHALSRTELDEIHIGFISRVVFWFVLLIGFSISLAVLGLNVAAGGLLTGGGFSAVVLAFAFREIGENLLAGFLLAIKRPFRVGDLVRSGEFEGKVKSIQVRHTQLRTADGRDIFVPSAMIYKDPLVNYTLDGLRRFSITMGIDYRDDAKRATALLTDAAKQTAGVLSNPAPKAWVTATRDNWVEVEMAYWVNVFDESVDRLTLRTHLCSAACKTLLDAGFTLSSDVSASLNVSYQATEGHK